MADRDPVDGIVHEMQLSNAGGVDFEVRVAPDAIDQVSRGQGWAANGPRRNRLDLVSRMMVCTVCFTQDSRIAA